VQKGFIEKREEEVKKKGGAPAPFATPALYEKRKS